MRWWYADRQRPSPTIFSPEKTKNSSSEMKLFQPNVSEQSKREVVPMLPSEKIFRRIFMLWRNYKLCSKLNYCLLRVGVIILLVSLENKGVGGNGADASQLF